MGRLRRWSCTACCYCQAMLGAVLPDCCSGAARLLQRCRCLQWSSSRASAPVRLNQAAALQQLSNTAPSSMAWQTRQPASCTATHTSISMQSAPMLRAACSALAVLGGCLDVSPPCAHTKGGRVCGGTGEGGRAHALSCRAPPACPAPARGAPAGSPGFLSGGGGGPTLLQNAAEGAARSNFRASSSNDCWCVCMSIHINVATSRMADAFITTCRTEGGGGRGPVGREGRAGVRRRAAACRALRAWRLMQRLTVVSERPGAQLTLSMYATTFSGVDRGPAQRSAGLEGVLGTLWISGSVHRTRRCCCDSGSTMETDGARSMPRGGGVRATRAA
jgi:hypothetical protein